jgi:urease gamma subunit
MGSVFHSVEISEQCQTYSQVAGLAAVIASATGGSAAQAESRAVGLDVAESLAVVALLGLSRAREGAAVGLVACVEKLLENDGLIA